MGAGMNPLPGGAAEASAAPTRTPATTPVAGLPLLVQALRAAGFRAGAAETVTAGHLLAQLGRRPQPPAQARDLAPWLRPVFCSTPEEQTRFDDIFLPWANRLQALQRPADALAGASTSLAAADDEAGTESPPSHWTLQRALTLLIGGVFALAILGSIVWPAFKSWREAAVPVALPASAVAAAATAGAASAAAGAARVAAAPSLQQPDLQGLFPAVRESRTLRPEVVWPMLLAPLALLLLAGGLPGLALMQGRRRSGDDVVLDMRPLAHEAQQVLPELEAAVAGRLERHLRAEAEEGVPLARRRRFDVRRTVEATVRHHGIFTPRYRAVPLRPSYLMLIDAHDEHDPRGRLFYLWAERMRRSGLSVDIRMFRRDVQADAPPQRLDTNAAVAGTDDPADNAVASAPCCWRAGQTSTLDTGVPLDHLEDPPAGQRLMVISEAAAWVQADGRWRDWFVRARLGRWRRRVFFTPTELRDWGLAEERVEAQEHAADPGFLVLPLDESALDAWSVLLASGMLPAFSLSEPQRFPRLLAKPEFEPFAQPAPDVLDRLIAQLKLYLGDSGFRWLAALAVPPLSRWELTLLIGQALFDHRAAQAGPGAPPWREILGRSYRRLARLPWLRGGHDAEGQHHAPGLPDWLRLRLLDELPKPVQDEVREIVGQLLSGLRPEGGDGLPLGFEAPPKPGGAGALSGGSGGHHDEGDRLYLGYLSGLTPRQLALRLPGGWREWLRQQPLARPGWRARLARSGRVAAEWLTATWARWQFRDGMPWLPVGIGPKLALALGAAAVLLLWQIAGRPDTLASWLDHAFLQRRIEAVTPPAAERSSTLLALSADGQRVVDRVDSALRATVHYRLAGPGGQRAADRAEHAEGTLRVWDAASGQVLAELSDEPGNTGALAARFEDRSTLLICDASGNVRRWSWTSPSAQPAPAPVARVTYSACTLGPTLGATAMFVDTANAVIDLKSEAGGLRRVTGRDAASAMLSPNGRWLVSRATGDGKAAQPFEVHDVHSPDASDASIAELADTRFATWAGDTLATLAQGGDGEWTITLRDLVKLSTFSLALPGLLSPTTLALDNAARYAAIGSADGTLVLWDLQAREQIGRSAAQPAPPSALLMSDDGSTVVSESADGPTQLWRAWQPPIALAASTAAVQAAISADGRRAAFASADGAIEVTGAGGDDGGRLRLQGPAAPVKLALSADGQQLAAASAWGELVWWSEPDGTAQPMRANAGAAVAWLAFTANDRLLAVTESGAAMLWRASNGDRVRDEPPLPGRSIAMAAAEQPDGVITIANLVGDTVTLRRIDGLSPIQTQTLKADLGEPREPALRFIAQGTRLAITERVLSGEWNLADGRYTAHRNAPPTRSTGMLPHLDDQIDDDGRLRATVSSNGRLVVRDVRSGAESKPPLAMPKDVRKVRWLPGGRLLVATASGTVSAWDLGRVRIAGTPVKLDGEPVAIELSGDGTKGVSIARAPAAADATEAAAAAVLNAQNPPAQPLAGSGVNNPRRPLDQRVNAAPAQRNIALQPAKELPKLPQPNATNAAPNANVQVQQTATQRANAQLQQTQALLANAQQKVATSANAQDQQTAAPQASPAAMGGAGALWLLAAEAPAAAPARWLDARIAFAPLAAIAATLLAAGFIVVLSQAWRRRRLQRRFGDDDEAPPRMADDLQGLPA